jgi:hypothetical protein
MGVDEIRMIIQTRRMASWALGIVRIVRDETGHTTARNLPKKYRGCLGLTYKILVGGDQDDHPDQDDSQPRVGDSQDGLGGNKQTTVRKKYGLVRVNKYSIIV